MTDAVAEMIAARQLLAADGATAESFDAGGFCRACNLTSFLPAEAHYNKLSPFNILTSDQSKGSMNYFCREQILNSNENCADSN